MSRRSRSIRDLKHSWVPFGIGEIKPHHYREMVRVAWENRDNLPYAWKILTRGCCDGCSLGTTGLRDWTIDGIHLCMVRLELLRLNTMPAGDPTRLSDVAPLRGNSSKELREMGRLAYPMRRRKGEPGFTRVGWRELWADVGARWREFAPRRTARYVTSRGVTHEVYYAVQKVLIERGWINRDFIEKATAGFDRLRAELEAQPMEDLLALCGSRPEEVEAFARELAQAERGIFVWSMGITQHAHGGDTVRAIVNLGLLREYVGRPGTGMMPIRGHSGVQGGAEMGAYATAFPGGVPIDADSGARFSQLWGFPVPSSPGLMTVEVLEAAA